MKMYRTKSHSIEIEEREVVKITEKMIFFLSQRGQEFRELKESNSSKWFEDRDKAVESLKKRVSSQIEYKKAEVKRIEGELLRIC